MCQARCLASNALENVVDEGVHDSHGLGRDAGVRMDLLQHLVHVHGVALLAAGLRFLPSFFWALVTAFLEPFLGAGADLAGSGMSIMTTPNNIGTKISSKELIG